MMFIISPGQNYYSLLQACSAWKKQQKIHRVIDGNHDGDVEGITIQENYFGGVSSFPPL